MCQGQGKPDQAVACYREAIELQPDLTEAHNNLGNVYHGLGQFEEAVACYGPRYNSSPIMPSAQQPGQCAEGPGETRRGPGFVSSCTGSESIE